MIRTGLPGRSTMNAGLLLLLSGCSTLSTVNCDTADWEQIGDADGAAGRGPAVLEEHRAVCARQGSDVDLVAYRVGSAAGRRRFCVPSNAFALGAEGEPLARVCPEDLRRAFERAHDAGRQVWLAKEELQALRRSIRIKHQELDAVDVDLQAAERQVRAPDLSWKRRTEWLDTINSLGRQRQALSVALEELEEQLSATESLLIQASATPSE